jgi:DNA polymerase bacteriophage-type
MITIDFETKSYADLPKVGAWAYSEDPTTDVICVCWAIDDGPVEQWWPGKNDEDLMPPDLYEAVGHGHEVEAHNVAFERSLWVNVLAKKYGWLIPEDDQWRDTMAVAQYYALPAALAGLARALGFPGKGPEGGRLITKYSKLFLKTAQAHIPDHEWVAWEDMSATLRKAYPEAKEAGGYFNEDFRKFVEYCIQDVELERAISNYLGDLPDRELPVFQLDQRINLRGLCLDREGIEAATFITEQRAKELTEEFVNLTGYKPTQRDRVMEWFDRQGLKLENLQAGYLEELIDDGELPSGTARRAIEIRLAINKASTKKLDAMSRQSGVDGRARFQMRYHGASTGRWTGSGFQPLNLNRGFEDMDPEQLVRDIKYKDAGWLDTLYGDAMDAVAKASRYWIKAPNGCKIISGDFVSIEAVILACLSGEEWKVAAFRDGVKIYEHMADKIYGLPSGTVSKSTHPTERQDGKTGELAFGYQGALGAWLKFDNSGRHTDERIIEICKSWRAEHPRTVALWAGLQHAAIKATRTGELVQYRDIGFEVVDEWLTMILPDGKRLWYYSPRVGAKEPAWCNNSKPKCKAGTCNHQPQLTLSYMAQKEGQWKTVYTYGGKLAENACQAVSRQILVPAMLRAEAAGYPIILSVYDEIVSEVPEDFGSVKEFESLMEGPLPEWCKNWPIRVDGWEGGRYKK